MNLTSRVSRLAAAAVIGLSALVGWCDRRERINDDVRVATAVLSSSSSGYGDIMLTGAITTPEHPSTRYVSFNHKTHDSDNNDIRPADFVGNSYRIDAVQRVDSGGKPVTARALPLYDVLSLTSTLAFPDTITLFGNTQFSWLGRSQSMAHYL